MMNRITQMQLHSALHLSELTGTVNAFLMKMSKDKEHPNFKVEQFNMVFEKGNHCGITIYSYDDVPKPINVLPR